MASRVDYIAPWWTYWLHNFPHLNLRLQPVDSAFNPQDSNYQQQSRGTLSFDFELGKTEVIIPALGHSRGLEFSNTPAGEVLKSPFASVGLEDFFNVKG